MDTPAIAIARHTTESAIDELTRLRTELAASAERIVVLEREVLDLERALEMHARPARDAFASAMERHDNGRGGEDLDARRRPLTSADPLAPVVYVRDVTSPDYGRPIGEPPASENASGGPRPGTPSGYPNAVNGVHYGEHVQPVCARYLGSGRNCGRPRGHDASLPCATALDIATMPNGGES